MDLEVVNVVISIQVAAQEHRETYTRHNATNDLSVIVRNRRCCRFEAVCIGCGESHPGYERRQDEHHNCCSILGRLVSNLKMGKDCTTHEDNHATSTNQCQEWIWEDNRSNQHTREAQFESTHHFKDRLRISICLEFFKKVLGCSPTEICFPSKPP